MKSEQDINIQAKKVKTIFLLAVLFIPIGIILFCVSWYYGSKTDNNQEAVGTEILSNIVSHMDTMSLTALNQYDTNLSAQIDVTVAFLKENVEDGKYTGERILPEGFMVTIDSDRIIIPEDLPQGNMNISKELIESSISSGKLRTGRLIINSDEEDIFDTVDRNDTNTLNGNDFESIKSSTEDQKSASKKKEYFLSFTPVTENDIYVHLNPTEEFDQYVQLFISDSLNALENAAEISEGMIVLMSSNSNTLGVMDTYGRLSSLEEFPESSINPQMIGRRTAGDIKIDRHSYRYICVEADATMLDADNLYIVQIFPEESYTFQMILQSVLICMIMLLIYVTVIVYSLAQQRFVFENVMTKEEAIRYSPTKLRRKLMNAGMLGAIAIFLIAFLTQTVSHLHRQIRYGEYTLQLVTRSVEQSVEEQRDNIKKFQEQWYVNSCQLIASFFSESPELVTQEKLAELSAILKSDYLMVFDSRGDEYMSSNDYSGFKLNNGLGTDSTDFRSLLMGIPSIVHEPSTDKVTKLERQIIGVTMTAVDDPLKHGALIIALFPNQTDVAGVMVDVGDEMALSMDNSTICFSAHQETGVIVDSTLSSMEGRKIKDCGLSEASLQSGYMDFDSLNGKRLFIITIQSGDYIFYYATDYLGFMGQDLVFSLLSMILYLIALNLIIGSVLKNYNEESYKKWTSVLLPNLPFRWKNQNNDDSIPLGADLQNGLAKFSRKRAFTAKLALRRKGFPEWLSKLFGWDNRLPEEKASLVFYGGLFLVLITWFSLALNSSEDVSLLSYLLYGDWRRGLNTFSFYCILLTFGFANVIITISSWIFYLVAGFLSSKGETICKLLRSIVKYITIIATIFISLSYIGLMNSTVIASMGLGSVILSLGAKDIVADILSGILIVFEQTLRIGDMVEYDDKLGIVLEVGMRTTKLQLMPGNNILEVRNHEIATVTNMSKYASTCLLKLSFRATESLVKIEELLKENLPRIGQGCNKIIGEPQYSGVVQLGREGASSISLLTIAISFRCNQQDFYVARAHMNKELYNLFDSNGIMVY